MASAARETNEERLARQLITQTLLSSTTQTLSRKRQSTSFPSASDDDDDGNADNEPAELDTNSNSNSNNNSKIEVEGAIVTKVKEKHNQDMLNDIRHEVR
jgi:uncharacterized protein YdeI (BOF family)